ncbi:hypothetical protein FRB97_001467 [Tulasnella sp. 331]|nr:hypothetical protein FRB97_001467 [Tulasnella sp. 331]
MSTPVSITNTSTPSSPLSSSDELLVIENVDQHFHDDDDLQFRLELAEVGKAEALLSLQETQEKLEALEAKHEELVEANQAFAQWRDDLELEREEWAGANARFAKRHLENKVARKALEAKYSTATSELDDALERHSEAQEEITKLKDQITLLVSPSASTAVPDVKQDPCAIEFDPLSGYDQCLALSVQGSLFRVSRRLLKRDSQYFEEFLRSNQALGDGRTGRSDAQPITLDGVQVEEMSDFLTFLHEPPFQTNFDHINIHQWAAILKLATLWSFNATRAYAISVFDNRFPEENCFDRLERAFACAVPKWVRPAYDDICRRPESLSANEGRRLGWERYAVICRIREDLARGTLDVPFRNYDHLVDFSRLSPVLYTEDQLEHSSNATLVVEEILIVKDSDTGEASLDHIDADASVKAVTREETIEIGEQCGVQSEPGRVLQPTFDEIRRVDVQTGTTNTETTHSVVEGTSLPVLEQPLNTIQHSQACSEAIKPAHPLIPKKQGKGVKQKPVTKVNDKGQTKIAKKIQPKQAKKVSAETPTKKEAIAEFSARVPPEDITDYEPQGPIEWCHSSDLLVAQLEEHKDIKDALTAAGDLSLERPTWEGDATASYAKLADILFKHHPTFMDTFDLDPATNVELGRLIRQRVQRSIFVLSAGGDY